MKKNVIPAQSISSFLRKHGKIFQVLIVITPLISVHVADIQAASEITFGFETEADEFTSDSHELITSPFIKLEWPANDFTL